MWERSHVAGALDIVLAPQRIHPRPGESDVPGGHGEVRHAHDHGRSLAVLRDSEAVVDGAPLRRAVQARCITDILSGHAGDLRDGLRRILRPQHHGLPGLERLGVATLLDVLLVCQSLLEDDVGEGIDHGHVGSGEERQVILGFDPGRAHQADLPGIDHDQLGALAQPAFHL